VAKPRTSILIGTHDGSFHADEAMACFLLRLLPTYKEAHIIRSRDPKILDSAHVVVDVGGVCDPKRHRYDHHQRGFMETFDEFHKIKLSSAGLVYKYFGREILSHVLSTHDTKLIETLFQKMYTNFIEALDGIDNGVDQYTSSTGSIDQQYKVSTDLSARVGRLNPVWNDPNPNPDAKFEEAVKLTGGEFMESLNFFAKSWLPCRDIVLEAVNNSVKKTGSNEILCLAQFCPWKSHLFEIEKDLEIGGLAKFTIFQDQSKSWRVQCVSVTENSFQNRISLPEPWRGKRDNDLSHESGIPGCIFVHASGFIGGNATFEGALKMAQAALKLASN